jgi:hypothetical protein
MADRRITCDATIFLVSSGAQRFSKNGDHLNILSAERVTRKRYIALAICAPLG